MRLRSSRFVDRLPATPTNVPLAEQAYKRRTEIQTANRQELAVEVLRALNIDKKDIGGAVD